MQRKIVALSGGKGSAWCAHWAMHTFNPDDVLLYFNDTKWEHPDLYRFLDDISKFLKKDIVVDADGRNPEELFWDNRALANNRMPFCSRILKAERLQKFVQDGDVLIFGIGTDESHRAERITQVYKKIADKKGITLHCRFPLIENNETSLNLDLFFDEIGVKVPVLYGLGFSHNNCSGGCVRAGKLNWVLLYYRLPEVYLERERVENEIREYLGKDVHYLKDITLSDLRLQIESGKLSNYYLKKLPDDVVSECVGICFTQN